MTISDYCWILFIIRVAAARLEHFIILDFLKDVERFHGFDYLLWMKNQNGSVNATFMTAEINVKNTVDDDLLLRNIMSEMQKPVLQMNEESSFFLNRKFSDHLITVVHIDGKLVEHIGLLSALVANLRHMTIARVVFLLNQDGPDDELLTELFKLCWLRKMPNVAALFANYQDTGKFYRYTHFPLFEIEQVSISVDIIDRLPIYPNRMEDLRGYKLPIIYGGTDPRIIAYIQPNGNIKYDGAVGHLLNAFTIKYNCTFVEPLPAKPDSFAPAQQLVAAVRNGTVEISAGLTFPTIPPTGYSYPFELLNWCLMMPVEADVPAFEFYIIVFKLSAFLLTLAVIVSLSMVLSLAMMSYGYNTDLFGFIVHSNCLRGALGQSFTEIMNAPSIVRMIYIQICILGILLTTWYNSYFSTYVTKSPKIAPLQTLDDILQSKVKIISWQPEYNELVGRLAQFRKYEPMFIVIKNYKEYLGIRESFDTKYGYMMPSQKWAIIGEQQKIFTTQLFRYRTDMCFFTNIPFGFPMHDNSIYFEPMKALIMEVEATGLSTHWLTMSFTEMIEAGKMSLVDLSPQKTFRPMQVEDLKYIWFGFAFLVALSTVLFLCEWLWFCRQRIWRRVRVIYHRCCCHMLKVKV